jgi:isopenicillin N synthase-like dioxygenase
MCAHLLTRVAPPELSMSVEDMTPSEFTSIPVIDLSKASNRDARIELLSDLRYALTSVGFLYISSHGIPETITSDLVDALPRLFSLSEQEKKEVALDKSPHFLGYSATGAEKTAGRTDAREQFEFATELTDDWREGQPLAEKLRGPNQVRVPLIHLLSAMAERYSSGRLHTPNCDQSSKHTFPSLPS